MRWYACLLLIAVAQAKEVVTTTPPQSAYDASHSYFVAVLTLALEKTIEYGTYEVRFSAPLEQGRAIQDLAHDSRIDVYWAGASEARARQLNEIPIPLVNGMLGMRLFAINEVDRQRFSDVSSLADLANMTACQGRHWPDSNILAAAGLAVQRVSSYELMWRMLERRRCDYFPRGVHEIYTEVAAREQAYDGLMIYPNLGIYYPLPMYFYTAPEQQALAERLEVGLERAIDDGSLTELIRSHPTTEHLFPLTQWRAVRWLELENPALPDSADPADQRYWFRPNG